MVKARVQVHPLCIRVFVLASLLVGLWRFVQAQPADSQGVSVNVQENAGGLVRVELLLKEYQLRSHPEGVELLIAGLDGMPAPGGPAFLIWSGLLLLPEGVCVGLHEVEREEENLGTRTLLSVPPSLSEKEACEQIREPWTKHSRWPEEPLWNESPARWLGRRVLPISAAMARVDEKGDLHLLKRLVFELRPTGSECREAHSRRPAPSPVLDQVVAAAVLNPGTLRELRPADKLGRYLVVTPDAALPYLDDWLLEKRLQGWEMSIVPESELADNGQPEFDLILERVQQEYEDNGVDCLLLVGDIDRYENASPWNLEAGFIPGGAYAESHWSSRCDAYDCIVSDHLLSLCEGDDYFADILVGRWSVDNAQQMATVVARSVAYETKLLQTSGTDWYSHGLMIYDIAGAGSRRETKQAIRNRLLDFGMTQVDTISNHYWLNPVSPYLVVQDVNAGVSLVNYRGYGQRSTWVGPAFNVEHITYDLSNAGRWPLVTSIVCGGGDFASVGSDPCFGEAWLRAGDAAAPYGAVAFIGPSEEDTHTRWNNCLDQGLYHGLVAENTRLIGALLDRGKQEVYECFPLEREWGSPGQSVPFYFHCYNLLGDPGLEVRTVEPCSLMVSCDTLVLGQSSMRIGITDDTGRPVAGARCCLLVADTLRLAFAFSDESGEALLEFDPLQYSAVTLGVSAPDALPRSFEMICAETDSRPDFLGLVIQGDDDGLASPRETLVLEPVFVERGSNGDATATLELQSLHSGLTIVQSLATLLGAMPGDTMHVDAPWRVEIASGLEHGQLLPMDILQGGEWLARAQLRVSAPMLRLQSAEVGGQSLEPGAEGLVTLRVDNIGGQQLDSVYYKLSSLSNGLEIDEELIGPVALAPGDTMLLSGGSWSLSEDLVRGESLSLRLQAWTLDEDTVTQPPLLNNLMQTSLGVNGQGDPLGPDAFGHLIYDNLDEGWSGVPLDQWFEISAIGQEQDLEDQFNAFNEGCDGVSLLLDLPFDFPFWGELYHTLTVNSNGWIAFGDQREYISGLNAPIPSAQSAPGLVAVQWTDLYSAYNTSAVGHFYSYHNQDDGVYVLEWLNFRFDYSTISTTFQIQLLDPSRYPLPNGEGQMIVHYQDARDDLGDLGVTIGIEDPQQNHGLQYTFARQYPDCAQPLDDGLSLWITSSPLYSTVDEPRSVTQSWEVGLMTYPNPANPVAQLSWQQPQHARGDWSLYNLRGARVIHEELGELAAGAQRVTVDSSALASGMYFAVLRLRSSDGVIHRSSCKMIMMK